MERGWYTSLINGISLGSGDKARMQCFTDNHFPFQFQPRLGEGFVISTIQYVGECKLAAFSQNKLNQRVRVQVLNWILFCSLWSYLCYSNFIVLSEAVGFPPGKVRSDDVMPAMLCPRSSVPVSPHHNKQKGKYRFIRMRISRRPYLEPELSLNFQQNDHAAQKNDGIDQAFVSHPFHNSCYQSFSAFRVARIVHLLYFVVIEQNCGCQTTTKRNSRSCN